jgi:hypothetical protein
MAEAGHRAGIKARDGPAAVEARLLPKALDEPEWTPATGDSGVEWLKLAYAWLVVALASVEVLLAFRFGFLLVGANRENGFVDIVYSLSKPLVAAFTGIVSGSKLGSGTIDPSVLIAMAAYFAGALVLMSLTWAIWVTGRAHDRLASRRGAQEFRT